MSALRKVLSISGGGIRGIIPATVLVEIEKKTQQPISQLFDLIAGTSTGGLLALGLTVPDDEGKPKYSARDMLQLYLEEGKHIFNSSLWYSIRSVSGVFDSKYEADGIEDVLDRYFGNVTLKEALTELLITSYEIERRIPWFFKSRKAKAKPGFDFKMSDVGRATSAAPTYFDPAKIPAEESSEYYALVDGGVFANNPAMCAYVEAKTMFPDDDILVVSLGTGEFTRSIPFDEAKNWGLAEWIKPTLSVVFDGVADTIDYQLSHLLDKNRFFCFQTRLDEGNDDMDDVSKTNMTVLQMLGNDLVASRSEDINRLLGLL